MPAAAIRAVFVRRWTISGFHRECHVQRVLALILLAALAAGPVHAGSISITPVTSTIVLGQNFNDTQPAIISVSIDSTNPMPPNPTFYGG